MPTRHIATKDLDDSAQDRLNKHVLMTATPKQIDNYIDNNVVDLDSAKEVLKILAKLVIMGIRRKI